MTNLPPDPNYVDRNTEPLSFVAVYERPTYPGARTGSGEWFTLSRGGTELGIVWTNGADGLGFIATTIDGIVYTPDIVSAFQGGAGAGTPAVEVFDWWAALATQGLNAGPVKSGDLDTLG